MNKPRILIYGKTGQLGQALLRALAPMAEVYAVGRDACDLTNQRSILSMADAVEPDLIINAAAYTAVDKAESDALNALTVNSKAPQTMARAAQRRGIPFIHFSTDYVFAGDQPGYYRESDPVRPLTAYGQGKARGEEFVLSECDRALVLRTSWVFSAHGQNFLNTMLRLAAERDTLRVVADQEGTPTSAEWLAEVTVRLCLKLLAGEPVPYGLYHLSAEGATTWHAYTQFLLTEAMARGYQSRINPTAVIPLTTADYPTPARRPQNSKLDCTLFRTTFPDIPHPDWQTQVRQVLDFKFAKKDSQ